MNNVKISAHSINTATGDIEGNFAKIKECVKEDHAKGTDLSIFPETAFSGYMCGSLWDRKDFSETQSLCPKALQSFMIDIGYKGTVIVGFVDFLGMKKNGFPRLKNAAAIVSEESIQVYHKQLLAGTDHHEDLKYFESGEESRAFTLNLPSGKCRVGVLICEDAWYTDHERNIPQELVENCGAEFLVCINQSYFYYDKEFKRFSIFKSIAQFTHVPVITVNALGVGDILKNIVIFDGGTMVFNAKGEMINYNQRFKETTTRFVLGGDNDNTDYHGGISFEPPKKFDEIMDALIFEQREFFKLCRIEKAQVHVSGGLDSAITAAVVSQAMGNENTVLITNPSRLNEKSDSWDFVMELGESLGIPIWENPIQSTFDEFMRTHTMSFDWAELSKTGQASVHAVLRTVQGLAASHQLGTGIVATGNHTEIVLGWASFHDIGSIGVHAILGDMTKMELFQFAQYLNEDFFQQEIIPKALYDGSFKPAAELPDAMEDPINYDVQSGVCAMLIRNRTSKGELLALFSEAKSSIAPDQFLTRDLFPNLENVLLLSESEFESEVDFAISKMKTSVYKAAQAAPIVIISPRSRGFSNRETLINKYV